MRVRPRWCIWLIRQGSRTCKGNRCGVSFVDPPLARIFDRVWIGITTVGLTIREIDVHRSCGRSHPCCLGSCGVCCELRRSCPGRGEGCSSCLSPSSGLLCGFSHRGRNCRCGCGVVRRSAGTSCRLGSVVPTTVTATIASSEEWNACYEANQDAASLHVIGAIL